MSEERDQKPEVEVATPEKKGEELIQLKINRENNELSFINPLTGKNITLKALIKEEEAPKEEEEEKVNLGPLSPEEFQSVFNRLDELGITWSADVPPMPRFKKGVKPDQTFNAEYHKIQKTHPNFPRELAGIILNTLMGSKQLAGLVGTEDELKEKVAFINERLITPDYRSEFFFKHAIKVPYFEDADWEIVIKAYERAVAPMPKSAYALLSLAFRRPVDPTLPIDQASSEYRKPEFVTVAANEYLLDKLIGLLVDARAALEKAQLWAHSLQPTTENGTVGEEQADESHGKRNLG